MKFEEPNDIHNARELLSDWESIDWKGGNSELHYSGLDKWKKAFDLLRHEKYQEDKNIQITKNLRIAYLRKLYEITSKLKNSVSSSSYFVLLICQALASERERQNVFNENPDLQTDFNDFKETRKDELQIVLKGLSD